MDDLDLGATIKGFSPGQKVFGRYLLKKVLGRGGMGVVWLAHDEKLDEELALKFLPEIVKLDATALDDLKRETKRARKLTHPGIVRIHDFLEDHLMAAIAMEAVDGVTLAQLRVDRPERCFEAADVTDWLAQLCTALDYAHNQARVVHHDLKPANIMLDGHGRVKITDFGIARSISDSISRVSAKGGGSSGTPAYMSPQQMLGEKPAVTDDIYALGATFYELLTGRPPFHTGNLVVQVQTVTPPSLASRRRDLEVTGAPIPEAWEQLLAACLAKNPAQRPQSTREVAQRIGGASVAPSVEKDLPVAKASGEVRVVELPGGLRLELAAIPAGEFLMGSPDDEPGRYTDESPRTRVAFSRDFWLGRKLVTHAQWRAVMGTSLADQARLGIEDDTEYEMDGKMQTLRSAWGVERGSDPAVMVGPAGDDAPMYYVCWAEAREFCRRLTEQERAAGRLPEGFEFNLPTEAQWEYGCRAGTRGATYAGPMEIRGEHNAPVLDAIAWYGGNSSVRFAGKGWDTAAWKEKQYPGGQAGQRNVGLKGANPWGLHDMLGNLWEWCLDLYAKYPGGAVTDPIGGTMGSTRVVRGGGWNCKARDCRTAGRNQNAPGARRNAFGFRVGLTPIVNVPAGDAAAAAQVAGDETSYPAAPTPDAPWRAALPSGAGLPLVWLKPGEFTMGSPEGEPGGYDEEGPRTPVTITRGFWLGRTPVTYGQWRAVMKTSLRDLVRRALQDDRLYRLGGKDQTLRDYWGSTKDADPGSRLGGEEDFLPVHFVTWEDGIRFAKKLTALEKAAGRLPAGYEYALPTEAQWEYACRAGTDQATYGGPMEIHGEHNAPVLDAIAWYGGNSSVGYNGRGWNTTDWADKQYPGGNAGPRAVGTRQPNAWGLHDMLGNVWEWCFDCYGKYAGTPVADPAGPGTGTSRISRGGAWNGKARDCRAACRNWSNLTVPASHTGFRVALAPALGTPPVPADVPAAAPASSATAAPLAAGSGQPSGKERFILLAFIGALLLGAAVIMWSNGKDGHRSEELERMRADDNIVLAQPDTITAGQLSDIAGRLERYRELGAEESEIQQLRERLARLTEAVQQRTPPAAPFEKSPDAAAEEFRPTITTVLAPGSIAQSPRNITSDGEHLFASASMKDGTQAIVRIASAGGEPTRLYPAYNPNAVAVLGDHIYWIDPNSGPVSDTQIWKAPKDGSGKPEAIYTGSKSGQPIVDGSGLTAEGEFLYAVDEVGGGLTRLAPDGTGLTSVVAARYEGGFATEHLNLAESDGSGGVLILDTGKAGVIAPALLHHTAEGLETRYSGAPLVAPSAVATDGELVFIADPGAGNKIWYGPIDGGQLTALPVPEGTFGRIGGLVFYENSLFATDQSTGAILRLDRLPTVNRILFGAFAEETGMTFSETALGYHMLAEGTGGAPEDGDIVHYRYAVSDRAGKQLTESSRGTERLDPALKGGLEEGLKLLQPGGRIRLLIPPHLGSAQFLPAGSNAEAGAVVDVTLESVERPGK
ncbi:MAG: SUMF1/EgtB/PvdO family nonheme iron enzyme [Lacunisphaera sp.]|nr:SUMF1/EgtB/PvdO family nonheme iron enzyme [Lacunisphaera sp.]